MDLCLQTMACSLPQGYEGYYNTRLTKKTKVEYDASRWEAIRKMFDLKPAILDETATHDCVRSRCKARGLIVEFGREEFGCLSSGKVHLCSERRVCSYRQVTTGGTLICPVSGFQVGEVLKMESDYKQEKEGENYDPNDEAIQQNDEESTEGFLLRKSRKRGTTETPDRVWGELQTRRNKKQKPRPVPGEKSIHREVRSVLDDLFDEEGRARIDRKRKCELDVLIKKALCTYYAHCESILQYPTVSEIERIIEETSLRRQRLLGVKRSVYIEEYYAELLNSIWQVVSRALDKPMNKKQFVVGCLYMMIPPSDAHDSTNYDSYLTMYLPSIRDLKIVAGGKYRGKITDGKNQIKRAFGNFVSSSEKLELYERIHENREYFESAGKKMPYVNIETIFN